MAFFLFWAFFTRKQERYYFVVFLTTRSAQQSSCRCSRLQLGVCGSHVPRPLFPHMAHPTRDPNSGLNISLHSLDLWTIPEKVKTRNVHCTKAMITVCYTAQGVGLPGGSSVAQSPTRESDFWKTVFFPKYIYLAYLTWPPFSFLLTAWWHFWVSFPFNAAFLPPQEEKKGHKSLVENLKPEYPGQKYLFLCSSCGKQLERHFSGRYLKVYRYSRVNLMWEEQGALWLPDQQGQPGEATATPGASDCKWRGSITPRDSPSSTERVPCHARTDSTLHFPTINATCWLPLNYNGKWT